MKKILLVLIIINYTLNAQSIPITGSSYHNYGPNSNWGEYLKVGGNGRETTNASVVATNGNLHLDSKDGFATYINFYSKGNTYINPQGGAIGIGTTSPNHDAGMHMYGNLYTLYGPNSNWGEYLQIGGNGRETTNAAVVTTNGNLHLDSKDGLVTYINHYSKGNTLINTSGGNVGIGTTSTGPHKLAVEGSIGAREIKVQVTGWSDFVFKKEYNLPTLEEVEKYIAQKGHLENILSEKEVLKDGINLGEMNSKLLQKIEELTLYMIEQNKRITKMEKENDILKNNQTQLQKTIIELTRK